jgi:hypothetical protein
MSTTQLKRDAKSITINIAKDFTDAPGGRYREDGDYSGQQFLEDLLRPAYEEAKQEGKKLIIELDNVYGYPSSFVSGSFGKLSAECKKIGEDLLSRLEFRSSSPTRCSRFIAEIKDPTQRKEL